MNSMIVFASLAIFVSITHGCVLTLGKGTELCAAIQKDVTLADISDQCTCGSAPLACKKLTEQGAAGTYEFKPVCEEIKKTLPPTFQNVLQCDNKVQLKNSYAKVDECNAENAAGASQMIAASTTMPMASEMMVGGASSQMVIQASEMESVADPVMATSMDMDMLSSMMNTMDSTSMKEMDASTSVEDVIAPSSSMEMIIPSSSVAAANEIQITHAVLFATALVAMLFSML